MRAARLDPSALSPSEHEAYESWIVELEGHLGRLQRGLRIGELLGFIRKRTVVDREAEITAFFGHGQQQQNLGVGEFIAFLRLLAHARTCSTLTRDHIFIQTSPLVLSEPNSESSSNPFFRSHDLSPSNEAFQAPPNKLASSATASLRSAASSKKKAPAPPPPTSSSKPVLSPIAASPASGSGSPSSLITPIAGNNPFRRSQNVSSQSTETVIPSSITSTIRLPPSPPESTFTAKSPPLPPRPAQKPIEPPPKHASHQYQYQKLAGEPSSSIGGPTPTTIKPYSVPAPGPTSIDIISSSVVQPQALQAQSTGQSNASSTTATRLVHQNTGGNRKPSNVNSLTDLNVRLLGSSHIGLDSTRLRKHPSPASSALAVHSGPPRYSPSSDELAISAPRLAKKGSDSSLSSLSGMLPRFKRGSTISSGVTGSSALTGDTTSRDTTIIVDIGDGSSSEDILSSEYTAKPTELARSKTTVSRSNRPPPPPPARRRPESLYVSTDPATRSQKLVFGAEPSVGAAGRGPFTATSISSGPGWSGNKGHHNRSASLSSAHGSNNLGNAKPSRQYRSEVLQRHASMHNARPAAAVDALLHKGRDVSQEWLEKARAATAPRLNGRREEQESLISRDNGRVSEEEEDVNAQPKSVQERRRELERLRTETEPGWSRLD